MGHDEDDDVDVVKPKGGRCQNVCNFLYNKDKGEVLGRTGSSWAKILLFYCVYYGALAAFFAICMFGFFSTLSDRAPTQQGKKSLLKFNPGMGYRPRPVIESTLISFNTNDPASYKNLVADLDDFLKPYEETVAGSIDCSKEPGRPLGPNEACSFPISLLGTHCTNKTSYGYSSGRPCVLLKINRIYDWVPINGIPENETDIKHGSEGEQAMPTYHMTENHVGITCTGQYEQDVDNVLGVKFYPTDGIPFSFYPYQRQPGYLSPLVMAQFDVVPGRLIIIECKAWAQNIRHHRVDRQGGVVFELLVDNVGGKSPSAAIVKESEAAPKDPNVPATTTATTTTTTAH